MDLKLICKKEEEDKIKELIKQDINFVDDSEYILITKELYENKSKILLGYLNDSYSIINLEEVLYFEALDDTVFCHTHKDEYLVKEKLYELEQKFYKNRFIRVSKSFIVNINKVKHIKPHINRKFILILENNIQIDVTRSYYQNFKNYIGL